MAEKGETTRQLPPADKLPELAQLVMENEGLRRKHRKVQHRRDHYARLYYRCQADFDEKKWELHYTRIKISELKEQLAALSLPHAAKQDQPTPTSTRSDIGLYLAPRSRPHQITQSHHHPGHSHTLHLQKKEQHTYTDDPPSKLTIPNSIPARPDHIPHRRSESDSTSPDSGASFSPRLGTGSSGVDPLLRSHPPSSFHHTHAEVLQSSKSRSLPRSMRLHQEDEPGNGVGRHLSDYPEEKEIGEGLGRVGGDKRQMEGEDWVTWVQQRNLSPRFDEEDGASSHTHSHHQRRHQPHGGWREEKNGENGESGDVNLVSDDNVVTPNSPVQFKNATPPPSIASPRARHPSFEQRLPLAQGFSLSQGSSLSTIPLSPSLTHPQKVGQKRSRAHPRVHFSLSQEAYMSSPLYIRKPVFKGSIGIPSSSRPTRTRTISEGRGDFQSPFPRDVATSSPPHDEDTQTSDSELEPALTQSHPQSAFRKPFPQPVYRQLSQPARLVPPVHYKMPDPTRSVTESTHPRSPPSHRLPHHSPPQQSPPPLPLSSRLPPPPPSSRLHPPPPPPTSHPPSLPSSHTLTHPHSTDDTHHHPSSPSSVGVTNPGTGVDRLPLRTSTATRSHARKEIPAQHEEEEEEDTEDEETDGGEEGCYEGLSLEQLFNLTLKISDPKCTITKLEIGDSDLGDKAAMLQLCKGLHQNTSLRELSLPNNNIGAESLGVLLQHIQHCTNIRELKLRGNNIGKGCAPLIKALMEQTSLNSLILTGNEIEKHGDLLHRALPSDFTMEYDTAEGSVDSGVVVAENEHFNNSTTSLKYLHV